MPQCGRLAWTDDRPFCCRDQYLMIHITQQEEPIMKPGRQHQYDFPDMSDLPCSPVSLSTMPLPYMGRCLTGRYRVLPVARLTGSRMGRYTTVEGEETIHERK
jgi:hypothetical protein